MPIGASKVGALGGLVPGGSVTFNASGTWDVPPGVKIVSVTGKGATGNPGIAGNPGNPGNPGSGGAGGGGGSGATAPQQHNFLGAGGSVMRFCRSGTLYVPPAQPVGGAGAPLGARGGRNPNAGQGPGPGCGQAGSTGQAGTAGQAGQPGNAGCSSSALCNTFPGGAGGNAGVAGAAGNGGTGGQGGTIGGNGPPSGTASRGNGGNGGGQGGAGYYRRPPGGCFSYGGKGGGGAGAVNGGATGATFPFAPPYDITAPGGTGNVVACLGFPLNPTVYPGVGVNTQGGSGGGQGGQGRSGINVSLLDNFDYNFCLKGPMPNSASTRNLLSQFNPAPDRPQALRAGAGGGSGSPVPGTQPPYASAGGGGGGGGRGNAGNAGGTSPTPSGSAATPVTYNCVPVTPGSPTPITVASPGGQVVISWNPQ